MNSGKPSPRPRRLILCGSSRTGWRSGSSRAGGICPAASASALDFATDAALRKALRELPWETTCLIVSQRTSSIRHADQILVLEDGRLAARGTHEELLSSCPVYQEIYDSQFRKEGDQ